MSYMDDICKNKHGGNEFSKAANPNQVFKSEMRHRIFEYIKSCEDFGATSQEISEALGIEINRVSGRCSELKKLEKVIAYGSRLNKSGKAAAVLVAIKEY